MRFLDWEGVTLLDLRTISYVLRDEVIFRTREKERCNTSRGKRHPRFLISRIIFSFPTIIPAVPRQGLSVEMRNVLGPRYQTIPREWALPDTSIPHFPYSRLVHREARLMNFCECRFLSPGHVVAHERRAFWKKNDHRLRKDRVNCAITFCGASSSAALLHINFFSRDAAFLVLIISHCGYVANRIREIQRRYRGILQCTWHRKLQCHLIMFSSFRDVLWIR